MKRLATLALVTTLAFGTIAPTAGDEPAGRPDEIGRVGFYSLADVTQTGGPTIGRLAAYASVVARPFLHAQLVAVNAHGAGDAELDAACRAARVNAIFVLFYQDKSVVEGARLHETAESHLDLFDCFGDIAFDGAGTAEAYVSLSSAVEGSYMEAKLATDRAFAILRDAARVEPSAIANLVRYGFPIAEGSRTAGLELRSGPLGAIASPANFGTAARAGMSRGDLVTAIDGKSVVGLGNADLRAAIGDVEKAGGNYVAEVVGKNGTQHTYVFASEDLAGYVRDLAEKR